MTDKRTCRRDGRKVVRVAAGFSATLGLCVDPRHLVSVVREAQARKSVSNKTDGCGDADGLIAEIAHEAR